MAKNKLYFVDILGVLPNETQTLKFPVYPGKPKERLWGEVAYL